MAHSGQFKKLFSDKQIMDAYKKSGPVFIEAAKAIGMCESAFRRRYHKIMRKKSGGDAAEVPGKSARPAAIKMKCVGIAEIAEKLDDVGLIKKRLDALPDGQLAYEQDLKKHMGMSDKRFREAVKDGAIQSQYRTLVPPREGLVGGYYYGNKRSVAELKEKL